jgi:regulator of RNase E activity RraA
MTARSYKGKIGFCIGADIERPALQLFEQLKNFGTPALADGLNKFNVLHPEIKPITRGLSVAGPAFTVRLRPGDNLMLHKAIGLAQPGDIVVVDTCGCKNYCVMGDLMASAAFKKGIGGFVIDGGIRDVQALQEKQFPIFARYIVPAVGDKDGPGEINMPISCGGVPVLPGDYIAADDNGVVVIPPYLADEIIKGTMKKLDYEARRALEIEQGIIMKPDIDEKLRSLGIIDSY